MAKIPPIVVKIDTTFARLSIQLLKDRTELQQMANHLRSRRRKIDHLRTLRGQELMTHLDRFMGWRNFVSNMRSL